MTTLAALPGDMDLVAQLRTAFPNWSKNAPSQRDVRAELGNCRADKAKRIMALLTGTPVPPDPVPRTAVPVETVRVPHPEPVPVPVPTQIPVPVGTRPEPTPVPPTPVRRTEPTPVPRTKKSGTGGKWDAVAYWFEEFIGLATPVAALIVAAVFQTQLALDTLHLPWYVAWLPAVAIEGGTVRLAILRSRHIVKMDSTALLTFGIGVFIFISCVLVGWHVAMTDGVPWWVALAMAAMAGMSAFLWGRRDAWRKRQALRELGLIKPRPLADSSGPQFAGMRWMMAPQETFLAFRHAVKNGISEPDKAIETYRASVAH